MDDLGCGVGLHPYARRLRKGDDISDRLRFTMPAPNRHGDLSPFEATRAMSSLDNVHAAAIDWGTQMQAVALRRDRDAFMRIYDHFAPRVRLYLRGLGASEATADELAQEAMLRLWQHAPSYDPSRSQVSTWLFRIARNLHIDRLRRERQWQSVDEELAPEPEEEAQSPGFSTAESYAAHVDLNERIERLSALQARLIRMSYLEAKSHQEIADELGMPLGTVKSTIRRAFIRLQSSLRGEA